MHLYIHTFYFCFQIKNSYKNSCKPRLALLVKILKVPSPKTFLLFHFQFILTRIPFIVVGDEKPLVIEREFIKVKEQWVGRFCRDKSMFSKAFHLASFSFNCATK